MFLLEVNGKLSTNFSRSVSIKRFLRNEMSKEIKTPWIHVLYLSLDSIPYVFQRDNEAIVLHNCLSKLVYCAAKFHSFVSRNKMTNN